MVRRVTTWDAKEERVPGESRVFLLDRNPENVAILEEDLLYVGEGVCQRKDGSLVRYKDIDESGRPADESALAAAEEAA